MGSCWAWARSRQLTVEGVYIPGTAESKLRLLLTEPIREPTWVSIELPHTARHLTPLGQQIPVIAENAMWALVTGQIIVHHSGGLQHVGGFLMVSDIVPGTPAIPERVKNEAVARARKSHRREICLLRIQAPVSTG